MGGREASLFGIPVWGSRTEPDRCRFEIPFGVILDRVTGSDQSVTDYVLEQSAKCPNCRRGIRENVSGRTCMTQL